MNEKQNYPNLILISGDGRNVGKTYMACQIIRALSKQHRVVALKCSPHVHSLPGDAEIVAQGQGFIVTLENNISGKDSSLMLQNGATKVFFVMSEKNRLKAAFESIKDEIKEGIVVAESGGLREIVQPGLFFFLKMEGKPIEKTDYLKYKPVITENTGSSFHPEPFIDVEKFLKSNFKTHV